MIAANHTDRESALLLLRQMLGPKAEFREGQWEAIDLVANQRRRVLVVQRTGWGKSVVYFLAAKILRDSGAGPALLISPLLALMRNQILAAEKLGIQATTIHSENRHDWEEVRKALESNETDLLLISPERLANQQFLQELLPLVQGKIGMFVVDEAHCISDWGHDFRPDYRRIVRILRLLPAGVPVLCTTATANDRVVKDIETQIPKLHILRGPLVRRSLKLFNIKLDDQAERMAWLAHFVPKLQGNGIIYTLTIQDARRVAAFLKQQGIAARAYHADLDGGERIGAERLLLENDVKALVATVALGMGFDKPDLGFVIHFQRPGSVVAYYQQVGRAGRAVDSAYGVLLSGREDDEIQDYFIRTAFPPAKVLEDVVHELAKSNALTIEDLSGELNYSYTTLDKSLRLLEVDGAVEREGRKYLRTANRWKPDIPRMERVTQHRLDELAQIKNYVEYTGCLMEFLSRALDDPTAAPCGKCMNCTGKTQRNSPPQELVQAAVNFLRSDTLILEPRLKWPKPVLEEIAKAWPAAVERFENNNPKSMLPKPFCAEEGRALCVYGDAGWGEAVAHGKYDVGCFSDSLVTASAELIQRNWKPSPAPEWVTAVPSQRHSELVREFAERLATALGLPFYSALRKRAQTPPQKEMQNSAMQVRNLVKAFNIVAVPGAPKGFKIPAGPVLLIDDVVDSRWTLTWAAVLLRQHGSGPVYPFALAKASLRGG